MKGYEMSDSENKVNEVTGEVLTDVVEAVPTIAAVANQVSIVAQSHNSLQDRVAAAEAALAAVLSFITRVIVPSHPEAPALAVQAPVVPVPVTPVEPVAAPTVETGHE